MTPAYAASSFKRGDLFAGVGDGLVRRYDGNGNLLETLDTGKGSGIFTTGCAFDTAGNLYVTTFNAGDVVKFKGPYEPHTNLGTFGSGYNGSPESIVFDAAGNVYVGAVNGDNDIRKFDALGNFLSQFDVDIDDRGSDWLDLAADQKTLFYTSEGKRLLHYNMANNTQLPDFTSSLPGTAAFALRILPDNTILVADTEFVLHLNSNGDEIKRYDAPNEDTWFSLNLDPDGTSFWAGNYGSGKFYKFNINQGGNPLLTVNSGVGANKLFGICVFGEITAGLVDNDKDGLPDDWEINGVDTTANGDPDLFLDQLEEIGDNIPPNPNHKDVYVWVDWLVGEDGHTHKPDEEALLLVKEAFAIAPIDSLNPDGKPGINLHIVLGRAIPETGDLQELGYENQYIYFSSEFVNLKKTYFQDNGNSPGMASVFHYALYAHYLPEIRKNCPLFEKRRPGGIAPGATDIGGTSDFIIADQSFKEKGGLDKYTQGGVFMHELGHTLDLGHGGVGIFNSTNFKPNHLSVMNYSFAKGLIVKNQEGKVTRNRLDYSMFVIDALEEDGGLLEVGGLLGGLNIDNYGTIYYTGLYDSIGRIVPNANEDIDWNVNKVIDSAPVKANINADSNGIFPFCSDKFTSLSTSSNEWEGLNYTRGGIGTVAALLPEPPTETIVDEPDIPPEVIMEIVDPIKVVAIDINPGSFPNSINPKNKGVIPVAILSTNSFNATSVDPLSVKFGSNGATEAHGRGHNEDADKDGNIDLVLHFSTQATGIKCGDTSASLTGMLFSGQPIGGSDSVKTVGCK